MNVLVSLLLAAVIQPLPAPEYADTEVSTNIPFAVSLETMSRIEFALTFDASPTNAVEVSVGTDENGDGRLSTTEMALTFGYACGRWFTRNADENRETDEPAPDMGRVTRTFLLRKRRLDPDWNLVKVVRRGVRSIGEIAVVDGFRPDQRHVPPHLAGLRPRSHIGLYQHLLPLFGVKLSANLSRHIERNLV